MQLPHLPDVEYVELIIVVQVPRISIGDILFAMYLFERIIYK